MVLSNSDGMVIARSAESKALGIKMGTPYFHLRDLITHEGLLVFSSHYTLYADLSERVMRIIEEMSPSTEKYSIDETFIFCSGMEANIGLENFGTAVKDRILKWTGIPCCVGFGPNKTLAKLANRGAKTYPATNGVVDLTDVKRQRKLMALVAVEDVWGIGRRLTKKLNDIGIHTALDLASVDPLVIGRQFNVNVERTVRELNGEVCFDMETQPPPKKQIICSRSFGQKVETLVELRQAVASFTERAAEKLRDNGSTARVLSVFIHTSPFAKSEPQYGNSASHTFITPTDDTRQLLKIARDLLDSIWREGFRFSKGGVMLNDFYQAGTVQQQLFDSEEPISAELMAAVDKINQRGLGKVFFAGQGIEKKWEMKRDFLSPSYTTRWDSLPKVK